MKILPLLCLLLMIGCSSDADRLFAVKVRLSATDVVRIPDADNDQFIARTDNGCVYYVKTTSVASERSDIKGHKSVVIISDQVLLFSCELEGEGE